jgi:hypothetical protein
MLVIGLGNPYRGDDGVGPVVARAMADRALESVTVLEHSGEGAGLAEMWAGMDMVILVDAVSSGGTPEPCADSTPARRRSRSACFITPVMRSALPRPVELARASAGFRRGCSCTASWGCALRSAAG